VVELCPSSGAGRAVDNGGIGSAGVKGAIVNAVVPGPSIWSLGGVSASLAWHAMCLTKTSRSRRAGGCRETHIGRGGGFFGVYLNMHVQDVINLLT
jgi:hypothetical protein